MSRVNGRVRLEKTKTAQERLKLLRDTYGLKWQEIAETEPFLGIPLGTLNDIYRGRPVPKRWRAQLGYTEETTVMVVEGQLVEGSLVPGSQRCGCGRWYVANHPRRRRCYVCSPIRRSRCAG